MDSSYPTPKGMTQYHVRGVPLGFALMFGAGVLSGLLGIGSGAVKVLAMDQAMKLPFQSVDHHEQFHDWRDGRGQRGNLSQPRIY